MRLFQPSQILNPTPRALETPTSLLTSVACFAPLTALFIRPLSGRGPPQVDGCRSFHLPLPQSKDQLQSVPGHPLQAVRRIPVPRPTSSAIHHFQRKVQKLRSLGVGRFVHVAGSTKTQRLVTHLEKSYSVAFDWDNPVTPTSDTICVAACLHTSK